MIHLHVDKALVYFDCESEFSATSHLHIHSAPVYSNIIPVSFVSKRWTHFVSVSSQGVYDLAPFFEHFKLKIMAVSFKLHLFKVAFSLWNWRTNTSQSLWTVDNWCRSHCWCLFVDLKVEVTRLWRRLAASQPLCALFSLRGLFFFFFLHITSDRKVLGAAQFWDSVFTGGAQFAHRWNSNRKPNKSWHIWTLVVFNSLFPCTADKWPVHTVGVFYYSGRVKLQAAGTRLPRMCFKWAIIIHVDTISNDIGFHLCVFWWLLLWLYGGEKWAYQFNQLPHAEKKRWRRARWWTIFVILSTITA